MLNNYTQLKRLKLKIKITILEGICAFFLFAIQGLHIVVHGFIFCLVWYFFIRLIIYLKQYFKLKSLTKQPNLFGDY